MFSSCYWPLQPKGNRKTPFHRWNPCFCRHSPVALFCLFLLRVIIVASYLFQSMLDLDLSLNLIKARATAIIPSSLHYSNWLLSIGTVKLQSRLRFAFSPWARQWSKHLLRYLDRSCTVHNRFRTGKSKRRKSRVSMSPTSSRRP